MTTFDVKVYETYTLANHCSSELGDAFQAQKRAKTFIEGAFSKVEGHSVNVTTNSDPIDTPRQKVHGELTTTNPCDGTSGWVYDDLGDWWRDYVQCVLPDQARDCDLLLTDYDNVGGVCWSDRYSVGEGGFGIANLPSSWQSHGCDGRYARIHTALQEFGHALMSKSSSFEHSTGNVFDITGDRSMSPMLYGKYEGGDNQCGNYIDNDDGCHAMYYSDCSESYMTRTY